MPRSAWFSRKARPTSFRIIGIIHRIGAVGAEVKHLATLCGQERLHRLLQRESGMIGTYGDAHRSPRFSDLPPDGCYIVLGREAELLLQFLERHRGSERLHSDAMTAPWWRGSETIPSCFISLGSFFAAFIYSLATLPG
jgi:hypothetical protein